MEKRTDKVNSNHWNTNRLKAEKKWRRKQNGSKRKRMSENRITESKIIEKKEIKLRNKRIRREIRRWKWTGFGRVFTFFIHITDASYIWTHAIFAHFRYRFILFVVVASNKNKVIFFGFFVFGLVELICFICCIFHIVWRILFFTLHFSPCCYLWRPKPRVCKNCSNDWGAPLLNECMLIEGWHK